MALLGVDRRENVTSCGLNDGPFRLHCMPLRLNPFLSSPIFPAASAGVWQVIGDMLH